MVERRWCDSKAWFFKLDRRRFLRPTRRELLRTGGAALGSAALARPAASLGSSSQALEAMQQPGDAGAYPYLHLDVFTDRPLTGNQLAVFLEPEGLSAETMQDIARELNFSETTFVFPPADAGNLARVRIFGRSREMQFAGHPVIGTAFAMALDGRISPGSRREVFELGLGPTELTLDWNRERLSFAWMSQQRPVFGPTIDDLDAVAAGLGLDATALQATGLRPQEVSCGNAFLCVPLATRADVDDVSVRREEMIAAFQGAGMQPRGMYVFSTEAGDDVGTAYSRMVGLSGFEDPATGSAAGPLGCYLVHHEVVPRADLVEIISIQGVAMQRPSRIYIRIGTAGDDIVDVLVGGESALVGGGVVRTG